MGSKVMRPDHFEVTGQVVPVEVARHETAAPVFGDTDVDRLQDPGGKPCLDGGRWLPRGELGRQLPGVSPEHPDPR